MDALKALQTRRSYALLEAPAPDDPQLRLILEAAAAGPDHGALRPIRLTLVRGSGLDALGAVFERAYRLRCHAAGEPPMAGKAEKERTKLHRAPLVIVVAAARQASAKVPWVDQRDAAVAAAMNILLATHALGFGGMWRTGENCDDAEIKHALGLSAEDAIVGFIYIGTPRATREPKAIDLDGLVNEFPS